MSQSPPELIAKLRVEPIMLDDWRDYGVSRASLKARISKLRAAGYRISTVPIDHATSGRKPGRRRAVCYVLVAEPKA